MLVKHRKEWVQSSSSLLKYLLALRKKPVALYDSVISKSSMHVWDQTGALSWPPTPHRHPHTRKCCACQWKTKGWYVLITTCCFKISRQEHIFHQVKGIKKKHREKWCMRLIIQHDCISRAFTRAPWTVKIIPTVRKPQFLALLNIVSISISLGMPAWTYALYKIVIRIKKKKKKKATTSFQWGRFLHASRPQGLPLETNRSLAHTENYYRGAGRAPKETGMVFKITWGK